METNLMGIIELDNNIFKLRAKRELSKVMESRQILQSADLESVFVASSEAITAQNWSKELDQFLSLLGVIRLNDKWLVKSYIARLIEKAYFCHFNLGGDNDSFRNEFYKFIGGLDVSSRHLFDDDKDHIKLPHKRQPSLLESFEATLDRFEFIRLLPKLLEVKGVIHILVGGSIAYGPFLNVRQGVYSSDIDIIVVVDDDFIDGSVSEASPISKINNSDWRRFIERKRLFGDLYKKNLVEVFSHRFQDDELNFSISVHFMPQNIFNKIFEEGITNQSEDVIARVKDFKESLFQFPKCDRWNFSGEKFDYIIPKQMQVRGGYIVELPAFVVQKERFHPGFYHHIVTPAHIAIHKVKGNILNGFYEHLLETLEKEKTSWPDASLLQSHPRRPIFAPNKFKDI